MRAITITAFGVLALAGQPSPSVAAPDNKPVLMETETLSDGDRWQGRHHYLYDEEHSRDPETTGASADSARACANEPVRVARPDGSTTVRRFKRCD